MDFLLPHGNWTSPPPRRPIGTADAPYADWLIQIFDEWYGSAPQRTSIRLFESLIDLLLGGSSTSEAVGLSPSDLITIETNGAIEQGDALKTTEEGMAATGLHVRSATFDDAVAPPVFRARQSGLSGLSATCRACPIVRVCGGGLYAHRYQADERLRQSLGLLCRPDKVDQSCARPRQRGDRQAHSCGRSPNPGWLASIPR